MKLARCNDKDCDETCGQRGLHVHGPWCEDKECGGRCVEVKAQRLWRVYDQTGHPLGAASSRGQVMVEVENMRGMRWPQLYRRGWRCRRVLVIEEG